MHSFIKITFIIILSSFIFTGNIFAKENNINTNNKIDKHVITYLKKEIFSVWGKPNRFNGKVSLSMIFDVSTGKMETFFIYKRKGDKKFIKYFQHFLQRMKRKDLKEFDITNPLVQIQVYLKAKTPKGYENPNKYTLLDKERNVYKKYLEYLIEEKGFSKNEITEYLRTKQDPFEKCMLYAIYFEYQKKNEKEANHYFNLIINRFPEKLKESEAGLIVSDWLIKEKKYNMILKLFPKRSCQFFQKINERKCYYYKTIAKYKEGLDYSLDIGIARNYFKQAAIIARKGDLQ